MSSAGNFLQSMGFNDELPQSWATGSGVGGAALTLRYDQPRPPGLVRARPLRFAAARKVDREHPGEHPRCDSDTLSSITMPHESLCMCLERPGPLRHGS